MSNDNRRVAIVTGGLTGIGLEIVKALLKAGVKVAVGSRSASDARASEKARCALDDNGLVQKLDVCSSESIAGFMSEVSAKLGTVDILVNCAGVSVHQTVSDHTDEDWQKVIDANLSGPFKMIRACLPDMKESGWGRIVNIASTAAHTAQETHAAYCASKAGVLGLTRAVAIEGAPFGITCNSVSPGWVETEMLLESAKLMADKAGTTVEQEIEAMAQSNPQKRLIQPAEVAAVVAFCCSEEARSLTMEDIQVAAGALW